MSQLVYGSKAGIPAGAEQVWQGKTYSAWQWQQELYDGSTATFEALQRSDTAHTIGVLPDGSILLVEDTQPSREAVITPAGGGLEAGETPEAAAKREFLEETGYRIDRLIPWHAWRPSAKFDWTVWAFIGQDLLQVGEPADDAGERIRLLTYSFDEFLALGSEPKMRDLIIRIMLLEAQLNPTKKEDLRRLLYDR
jgi:ADP-ribose pyrophosphatase